jgi:hypothetical protein
MGNPTGTSFFDGYGYGMTLPTDMYLLPSLLTPLRPRFNLMG